MKHMIEPAAHRRGAMAGVSERKKIALKQPNNMRRRYDKRDANRKPWPRCDESAPGLAIQQHEQCVGDGQDDDKIFCPQRPAHRDAKQTPRAKAAAPERRMKSVSGERPKRQLDDVVIEFDGGGL